MWFSATFYQSISNLILSKLDLKEGAFCGVCEKGVKNVILLVNRDQLKRWYVIISKQKRHVC